MINNKELGKTQTYHFSSVVVVQKNSLKSIPLCYIV